MASKIFLVTILVALFAAPSLAQFYGSDADPYASFAASGNDGNNNGNGGYDEPNFYCVGASDETLCTKMVGKDTELWKDAIMNALKFSINVAGHFNRIMPVVRLMATDLPESSRSTILNVCSQSFRETMLNLQKGMVALNSQPTDLPTLASQLGQSVRSTCADTLIKEGVNMPAMNMLTKYYSKVATAAVNVVTPRD